jgi:hypothetical protein
MRLLLSWAEDMGDLAFRTCAFIRNLVRRKRQRTTLLGTDSRFNLVRVILLELVQSDQSLLTDST